MLFCGPSGDGKTTTARILANELNKGKGNAIEMDAASHNGVEDVREIIKMASSKTIDGSEYKVFIIDECHSLSDKGWQAFLKCIEEPPAKVVFIFCTTDPQKLPATILGRVQRFQFQKVSTDGIFKRLVHILSKEYPSKISENDVGTKVDRDALMFIAKLADGGMRLAIQYLEKCLAYSDELTVENVVKALNVTNYDDYIGITNLLFDPSDRASLIMRLDEIYASGVDFKQFLKQYVSFILDVNKALILDDLDDAFQYINLPRTSEIETWLTTILERGDLEFFNKLLSHLVKLDGDVKYSQSPKVDIEAGILLFEV
jgi:DNA polymerase-3 subunit gamma/tau